MATMTGCRLGSHVAAPAPLPDPDVGAGLARWARAESHVAGEVPPSSVHVRHVRPAEVSRAA